MKSTKSMIFALMFGLVLLAGCAPTAVDTTDDAMMEEDKMEGEAMMEDDAGEAMMEDDAQ